MARSIEFRGVSIGLAIAALLLVLPATASAADRYAEPNGNGPPATGSPAVPAATTSASDPLAPV